MPGTHPSTLWEHAIWWGNWHWTSIRHNPKVAGKGGHGKGTSTFKEIRGSFHEEWHLSWTWRISKCWGAGGEEYTPGQAISSERVWHIEGWQSLSVMGDRCKNQTVEDLECHLKDPGLYTWDFKQGCDITSAITSHLNSLSGHLTHYFVCFLFLFWSSSKDMFTEFWKAQKE